MNNNTNNKETRQVQLNDKTNYNSGFIWLSLKRVLFNENDVCFILVMMLDINEEWVENKQDKQTTATGWIQRGFTLLASVSAQKTNKAIGNLTHLFCINK